MAPPTAATARLIPCPFCCLSFRHMPNLARHVQTSHRNESRCAAAAAASAVMSQSFVRGSLAAMASAPGPALLAVDATAAGAAATDDIAVDVSGGMDVSTIGASSTVDEGEAPPNQHDMDVTAAAEVVATDVPACGGAGNARSPSGTGDESVLPVGDWLYASDEEEDSGTTTDDDSAIGAAAVDLLAALPQHVFLTSTAARIRAYYLAFPETSQSTPAVPRRWASRPSRFCSPALRGALRFALTAGGCDLTERDHVAYAQSLCAMEQEATRGTGVVGPMSAAFPSAHGFLTAARHEQNRVLATRRWMEVKIEIGASSFMYYYRDVLQVALDALAGAETVSFGHVPSTAAGVAAASDAGDDCRDDHERRGTLDADLYVDEIRNVRRLHGADARVLGVHLHADEALVSWSGAHYMFPVRVNVVNVLDNGGQWQTVGYVQHISKAIGRNASAKLVVSDMRNDLLQRCLAVSLRAFTRASEEGVTAHVAGHGSVLLVPRVVGLIVDQVEERSILALMGNRCRFFCSPCMEDKDLSGGLLGVRAVDRNVVSTLEAQLAAAVLRADDPRPSRRRDLGRQHSALPFVPALGAVHGLATRPYNLFRIVFFLPAARLDVGYPASAGSAPPGRPAVVVRGLRRSTPGVRARHFGRSQLARF